MTTLAEIRAKLKAEDDRSTNKYSGDNTIYPHWNVEDGGDPVQLRFLPDGDESNTYFWVVRQQIKLKFAGIKGQPNSKPLIVKVPCMEMWEPTGSCPVLAEIRPWFDDPKLSDLAHEYWKKRSYLMQGFVHADPFNEDNAPENPIRRFIFTPQIFELIKASLIDPELEEIPTDYTSGLDFIINKTTKGKYADYTTSKWSRRETALTQDELDSIEEYGLNDLKTFLPKKPDAKHLEIIKEMFEASLDGEAYDPDRWAAYYRAPGMAAPTTPVAENAEPKTPKTSTKKAEPVAKVNTSSEANGNKAAELDTSDSDAKAQKILDMIRNRK